MPPSIDDIHASARRLAGVVHRTPVLSARGLRDGLFLKPENLQRTGSFKFRGAYNAVAQVPGAPGVCAVSSGKPLSLARKSMSRPSRENSLDAMTP